MALSPKYHPSPPSLWPLGNYSSALHLSLLHFLHKLPLLVPAFSSPSNAFQNDFQLFIFFSTLQRPQCRKLGTNISKKGTVRLQCQFLHSCFSDGLGKYRSLTDTWMWKFGPKQRNSFSGNNWTQISLQCAPVFHTHCVTNIILFFDIWPFLNFTETILYIFSQKKEFSPSF